MEQPIIPGLNLPVRTIYCIGRNYAEHAKELQNQVPDSPIVFLKPLSSICYNDANIHLPQQSKEVHHEAEVVVAISKSGKNIPENSADAYIGGIGVGIDFTARDIQQKAKEKGHPWSIAKGFDQFAAISSFVNATEIDNPNNLHIELFKNGMTTQKGNTSEMIFSVEYLISFLSSIFTLYPGDLIFTGTPSGVGKVEAGDKLEVLLNSGLCKLSVKIT